MSKFTEWLGLGLRGEIEKSRIALGVAREIADNWRGQATESQKKLVELMLENDRLKVEYARLKEHHEQQQRAAKKVAQTLSGQVPITLNLTRK